MSRLQQLHQAGVSIWLDTLSRELLDSGAFSRSIVASVLVSRVDTKADTPWCGRGQNLRGRVAVTNAQRAYALYRCRLSDQRWRRLRDADATRSGDRCGRAPGPRTRPTQTSCTSSS